MIALGKQWPLNISFFDDKCKCLAIANLDATELIMFAIIQSMHLVFMESIDNVH